MLKILFFLAFLTQKLAPSHVLNGIIFTIDEQCNLIFETALFTNGKPYTIFLFSGAHFLFFFVFLISVPCFTISLLSLPLLDVSTSLFNKTQARASSLHIHWFLFLFFYSLNALSLLYLSLSSLTSFFSLLSLCFTNEWAPSMIVLRRLWDADGCGLVAMMEVPSSSFFFFFCSAWFFLGLIGLRSCEANTKRHAIKSLIRFWVLIWFIGAKEDIKPRHGRWQRWGGKWCPCPVDFGLAWWVC